MGSPSHRGGEVAVPAVRRGGPDDADAVAELIYESSARIFDRYAGGPARAVGILTVAYRRPGNSASAEVVTVAELDGRLVAAMAAYPVSEGERRAGRFLRLSLRKLPPWRWPGALALFARAGRVAPPPPPHCLYVDALATAADARRRGAASALLIAAEEEARHRGLGSVALDTGLDNAEAQDLYRTAGFRPAGERPPAHGLPGFMALVKPVES